MSLSTPSKKILKLVLAISLFSGVIIAQALTISPARVELSGDPGTTISGDFTLINEQNTTQTFYASAQNFEAQGESGTPNFSDSKEGLASWVKVEGKVTLKPGERVKVPYTITVPKDADAGGHFAAIFLSTVEPNNTGATLAVGAKVGMLILLRVAGDIKEGGGLLSFGLKEGGHFSTTLPINFVYRFNNSGNDRVNPVGTISIRDMIGLEAANLNANPSVGNILPGSTRRFDITWGSEAPLPDSASFFNHVSYEARNFAFGFYFANINLTFNSSSTTNNSLIFFVFPWHLVLVVLVILLIAFVVLQRGVKRYNRFIIKQARLASAH
jgi:hypothetical protein